MPVDFAARSRARRRALQALYQWHINPQATRSIAAQFIETQDFHNVDESYFRFLLDGVAERNDSLIELLEPALDRPLNSLSLMEKIVLLIGVFELTHSPGVPWRVAIDESVDLAKRFGSEQGHSYVNAVLDALAARQGHG